MTLAYFCIDLLNASFVSYADYENISIELLLLPLVLHPRAIDMNASDAAREKLSVSQF